ncbi:MAG: NAD-dependent protein deacetylase [Deltaproteobacteria bacterium]
MTARGGDALREAAETIASRGQVVALTGAGISVDSGIPAFRGAQGMWNRYDPMEYATLGAFRRDPEKVWGMLAEMVDLLRAAVPNPAHKALATLERMGLLRSVITQNVDGLHQEAGSRNVIEFHGAARDLICLSCRTRYSTWEKIRERIPPRCTCGEILKPDIVFFGELIPRTALALAEAEAETAAVLLVVGTSAEVTPACDIPRIAKRQGALIVEINPEETVLTRFLSDLHLREPASSALSRLLAEVQSLLPPHPGNGGRP